MWNEMVRELINLPRFTAWCKIVKEVAGEQKVLKHQLQLYPLLKVENEATVLASTEAYLRTRMHDETLGYYRQREQVQQEIAARRTELKKPIERRRRIQEEDEA